MIQLEQIAGGILLPVHAQPGARKNGIVGEHAGRLKVAVTQAPEQGKANKALIETLAQSLNLSRSQILLHSGETSRQKKFLVVGVTAADLGVKIARWVGHA
jgi:uncharacterized protein (TIGR00251 family)